MHYHWFKKWGWIYLPTTVIGGIITLGALIFIVRMFQIIDSTSHSISDTLIGMLPWVVLTVVVVGVIGSKASR